MTDAKDYTVEYGGSKVTFTATDGTVAKVGITATQIPAATATKLQATTMDAKGVVLGYTDIDATDTAKGKVTSEAKFAKGYQDGASIYLPSVGDTATVKVTYHTGTFGTDGKETGNIEETFTVTAVDPSLVNLKFEVTIAAKDANQPAWTAASFKSNNKIAIGAEKKAFFRITKDDGSEIKNYSEYTVESADKTKLLVEKTDLGSKSATVTGVAATSATYILIKKDDKTVASLPVVVLGKPVATTMDLSKTSVTVVENASVPEVVTATIKDQYGDNMGTTITKVEVLGKPNGSNITDSAMKALANGDKITLTGTNFDKTGAYTLKITGKNGDKELTRALTVNVVKTADKAQAYEVKVSQNEVDTTVGAAGYAAADKQIKINVAEMVNGGALDYLTSGVEYTVKNAKGDVIAQMSDSVKTTSCAAISANAISGAALTVSPVTINNGYYEKNLAAGTYSVTAKFTAGTKTVTVGGSFTIKDTQDARASFKIEDNNFATNTVAAGFSTARKADGTSKFVTVWYDGIEQNVTRVDDVDGVALTKGGAFVKTVKLYVEVSGSNAIYVPVTLNVNDQIDVCAGLK